MKLQTLRRQKGASLFSYVIAGVVGVALTVAVVVAVQGQRQEAELSATQEFITGTVPSQLASIYYNANRNYTRGIAGTNAATFTSSFLNRTGFQPTLPDGSPWVISAVGANTVTFVFGATAQRNRAATADALTAGIQASDNEMVKTKTGTPAPGATKITTGSFTGPSGAVDCAGADGPCVQVVYDRPR